MEEHLQHDPRIKNQIRDILFAFLYTPIERHFKKQLDSIIIKNSCQSFSYKGVVYALQGAIPLRNMTRLSPILHPIMDEYLEEVKQLNKIEVPYVIGFINRVLNLSNNLQLLLEVLPASIHGPIEKLIASYPHRILSIDPATIQKFITENQVPIDMIKRRLLSNLLI